MFCKYLQNVLLFLIPYLCCLVESVLLFFYFENLSIAPTLTYPYPSGSLCTQNSSQTLSLLPFTRLLCQAGKGTPSALPCLSRQVSVPSCTCHLNRRCLLFKVCSLDISLDVREPEREEGLYLLCWQDRYQIRYRRNQILSDTARRDLPETYTPLEISMPIWKRLKLTKVFTSINVSTSKLSSVHSVPRAHAEVHHSATKQGIGKHGSYRKCHF